MCEILSGKYVFYVKFLLAVNLYRNKLYLYLYQKQQYIFIKMN